MCIILILVKLMIMVFIIMVFMIMVFMIMVFIGVFTKIINGMLWILDQKKNILILK